MTADLVADGKSWVVFWHTSGANLGMCCDQYNQGTLGFVVSHGFTNIDELARL